MNPHTEFSRRRFVKTFTFGAAFSLFMGKPWRGTWLAEVHAQGNNALGTLRVKLSDYPALQTTFGSVRLAVVPFEQNPPAAPVDLSFYPIIINRALNNRFYALNSACQHAGCVVPVYDPVDQILCPCHGSRYAIDGALVSNGPASGPLIKYPITFDGANLLNIQVPGLGYRVDASIVDTGTGTRLELDFPTLAAVEYEVRFRARVRDAGTATPFSTTVDGVADQTSLIGDDLPATVFVDRTTQAGFYSVAIKILDLTIG